MIFSVKTVTMELNLSLVIFFSGSFLGIKTTGEPEEMDNDSKTYTDDQDIDPAEEKQNFEQMMKNVGAADLFDE